MPFQPVLDTRFASSFTITEGNAAELESTITWPSVTVDYGNEGSENEPPTRSYVGDIEYTAADNLGTGVALIMPLSNENVFVQEPLGTEGLRCSVKWVKRFRRF